MHWWQAIVLGLVEGLTEFLPVSSTGHLLLTQRALGIAPGEAANAYAICIQAGAILAVLLLYTRRVAQVGAGLLNRDADGRRLAINLVVAFLPAAVVGFSLGKRIEAWLFGPWPVVAAWLVGGVVILLMAGRLHGKEGAALAGIRARDALIIGLAQCLALWPGTSRSLVTILAALLLGFSLTAAVEFSFLLGLVTLGAATAYKAIHAGPVMLEAYGPATMAAGFVASWGSALLAVRWMVAWLDKHGLALFGWWRILLGTLTATLLLAGVL